MAELSADGRHTDNGLQRRHGKRWIRVPSAWSATRKVAGIRALCSVIGSFGGLRTTRQQLQLRPQLPDGDPHCPCRRLCQALVGAAFDSHGGEPGGEQERWGLTYHGRLGHSRDCLFNPVDSGFESAVHVSVAPYWFLSAAVVRPPAPPFLRRSVRPRRRTEG